MSVRFALELIGEFTIQSAVRILTILDLVLLSSWSPVWTSPSLEPLASIADCACYTRFICLNVARSFKFSTSIWPDAVATIACLVSIVVLSDVLFNYELYYASFFIISLEFGFSVLSAERRRQRKLWTHNATFRISNQFRRRNPFQRSIRKSLLRPLLPVPTDVEAGAHDIHLEGGKLISSFMDVIPEVKGRNPEKRILHVHCLFSYPEPKSSSDNPTIVFLHQFGSGAFTWQYVMADLRERLPNANLIAFDRTAHGLTFPSDPILPERSVSDILDVTPTDEENVETVSFQDSVNSSNFEIALIDNIVSSRHRDGAPLVIVSCGGSGANLALAYASQSDYKSELAGIVVVSPYLTESDGIPSVLRSVASAQVGRALLVSMAKSEVTDVILRRSWDSSEIPSSLVEGYKKAVEMPLWEELMVKILKRPLFTNVDKKLIACPVVVVSGERDHFVDDKDHYTRWSSDFPKCHNIRIPMCGASPQEENPHEVSVIINNFIRKNIVVNLVT